MLTLKRVDQEEREISRGESARKMERGEGNGGNASLARYVQGARKDDTSQ